MFIPIFKSQQFSSLANIELCAYLTRLKTKHEENSTIRLFATNFYKGRK